MVSLPTLTSHSWLWIPGSIGGDRYKQLIAYIEAQRACILKLIWKDRPPALDEALAQQISQCAPQDMTNPHMRTFQVALTTPDAEELAPWVQLQTSRPVNAHQPQERTVGSLAANRDTQARAG